jgi:hypothetical protein
MMFLTKEKIVISSTRSTARVLEKIKMMTLDLFEKPKHLIPKEGLREKRISHLRDSRWYFDH